MIAPTQPARIWQTGVGHTGSDGGVAIGQDCLVDSRTGMLWPYCCSVGPMKQTVVGRMTAGQVICLCPLLEEAARIYQLRCKLAFG